STALLLDLMTRARTGPARLKGLLPPDTVVAHKTGTTETVIDDVGIITLPDDSAMTGHIALAVFAVNGRPRATQQTIARLSAAAFEFFTGRPLPKLARIRAPNGKRRMPARFTPATVHPAGPRSGDF